MNPLQALESRPKSTTRLTRSSRVFKTIINAIHEKKGERVVSLDLRKIPEAVADFFIICEASTATQVKGISDFVQDKMREECGETPYRNDGYQHGKWVLLDYVNIVVHIMHPETRHFYQLEELWSDGALAEHVE